MNYQMLLECHAAGTSITKQEAKLLDLELESQIASIKVSRLHGCIEVAPDHICQSTNVCQGSFWITCFAAVLDKITPVALGKKTREENVFDELISNGYIATS